MAIGEGQESRDEELFAITRDLIARAILTLAAIPDPDLRFRVGPRSAWPDYVREARDAYASAPPRIRAFAPSPNDLGVFLDVLDMLNAYRRAGSTAAENVRLFTARVFGAPIWMLQQRCTTNRRQPASKQTVYDRLDAVVSAVMRAHREKLMELRFDKLDELDQFGPYRPYGGDSAESDLADLPNSPKAWIAADGKPLPFDHPAAVAARIADAESARSGERLRRRYADTSGKKSSPGKRGGKGRAKR